jgi:hypothetical protein
MCGEEMSLVKLCFDLLLINTDGVFYTDSIQGFLEGDLNPNLGSKDSSGLVGDSCLHLPLPIE